MSSPFQSAFMARSPLAELNAKQKANLPIELQTAINAKDETSSSSPLGNHGDAEINEAKKLSKQGDSDGDFDYSNEKVVALKDSGQKKNATHTNSKDQDENQNLKDEEAARMAAARS